jgi:exodeoxyribonuclease VII large subunit
VPVISAVGHEVDTTLTDLAADRRAATPTMAGEMAVPVLSDLAAVLAKEERRLHRELELRFRTARQELDQLSTAADGLIAVAGAERRRALAELGRRLESQHPRAKLASRREVMARLEGRLDAAARRRLDVGGRAFGALAARLAALSPLRVLERGYAIASRDDSVVTAATDVAVGDPIAIRLARGALDCRVEAIHPERSSDGDEVG